MARSTIDWDDLDDDDEGDDSRGKTNEVADLRNAYKALKRENKALTDRLTAAESGLRERSVKDVLASKGLPEKVSALIPANITSAEDVQAWVDQYADVFGTPTPPPPADDAPPTGTDGQPLDLAALGRIAAAQSQGAPFTGDADQIASLIAGARTPEELNKILFNNPNGPAAI